MAIGEYLTTTEAARELRVSAGRIRQFCVEGRLAFEKVGSSLLFHRSVIQQFKKTPRKTGRPKAQ